MSNAPVFSVLNFKGGTFKTTTVENLADALRRRGKRVGVIDGCRQCNSSSTLLRGQFPTSAEVHESSARLRRRLLTLAEVFEGKDEEKVHLRDVLIEAEGKPGLYVVPGSGSLEDTAIYIAQHRAAYYVIQRQVAEIPEMDVWLIDHAGAYTPVMEALLLASTGILIPCQLEPYAVGGLFDMFNKLKEKLPDHELRNAGIIPSAVDLRYGMSRQYLQELRDEFGPELVTAPIRTDAKVRAAQSLQMTIFEYEEFRGERSNAAEDFYGLADDLIEEYGL
jgi:cellulose biosynthesis protein BcsQ